MRHIREIQDRFNNIAWDKWAGFLTVLTIICGIIAYTFPPFRDFSLLLIQNPIFWFISGIIGLFLLLGSIVFALLKYLDPNQQNIQLPRSLLLIPVFGGALCAATLFFFLIYFLRHVPQPSPVVALQAGAKDNSAPVRASPTQPVTQTNPTVSPSGTTTEIDRDEAYNACIVTLQEADKDKKKNEQYKRSREDEVNETLTIATGQATGSFFPFGANIAAVTRDSIRVVVETTQGARDNIITVLSKEKISLGITHLDVLLDEANKKPNEAKNIRIVLPLYRQEVHVLARKELDSLQKLEGKKGHCSKDSGSCVSPACLV